MIGTQDILQTTKARSNKLFSIHHFWVKSWPNSCFCRRKLVHTITWLSDGLPVAVWPLISGLHPPQSYKSWLKRFTITCVTTFMNGHGTVLLTLCRWLNHPFSWIDYFVRQWLKLLICTFSSSTKHECDTNSGYLHFYFIDHLRFTKYGGYNRTEVTKMKHENLL